MRYKQIKQEFSDLCRRLGLPPRRTLTALLKRETGRMQDQVLTEAVLRGERIRSERSNTMPRKPKGARKPAPTDDAAKQAAEEAGAEDPLAALAEAGGGGEDAPDLDSLAGGEEPAQGLDALAEGVTPEAIKKAVESVGVTPGAGGADPVVASALATIKTQVTEFASALTNIEARLASIEGEIPKFRTGVQKSYDKLATAVEGHIDEILKAVKAIPTTAPAAKPAPAPKAEPTPEPSSNGTSVLVDFIKNMGKGREFPLTNPSNPNQKAVVFAAFAQQAAKENIATTPEAVEAAAQQAGLITEVPGKGFCLVTS